MIREVSWWRGVRAAAPAVALAALGGTGPAEAAGAFVEWRLMVVDVLEDTCGGPAAGDVLVARAREFPGGRIVIDVDGSRFKGMLDADGAFGARYREVYVPPDGCYDCLSGTDTWTLDGDWPSPSGRFNLRRHRDVWGLFHDECFMHVTGVIEAE